MAVETEVKTFKEFWGVYVLAHQDKKNQALHFIATLLTFVFAGVFAVTHMFIFLALIPVFSYSLAWIGHFLHERNKPLTWKHPIFSLIADYKMFFMLILGRLDQEIAKAKITVS